MATTEADIDRWTDEIAPPAQVDPPVVDDDTDDEEPDDLDEEVAELEATIDRRARHRAEAAAGLRRPAAVGRQVVAVQRSPWEGKSREELNRWAHDSADANSRSPIGRTVSGRVNTP